MRRENERPGRASLGLLAVVLCAALASPSAANAQSWSGFSAAFPAFPCQDGWVACVVGGTRVEPAPAADDGGRLVATDLRVGWFDLEASPTFSPFSGLSVYTVAAPTVAAAAEEVPEPGNDGIVEAAAVEPSPEMVEAERRAEAAAAEAAVSRASEAEARQQAEVAKAAQRDAEATAKKQRAEEDAAKKEAAEAARRAVAGAAQAEASERERLQREADTAQAKATEMEKQRLAADKAAEKQKQEAAAAQAKAAEEERRRQEADRARQAADEDAKRQAEEDRVRQEEAARARAEQEAAAKAKAEQEARAKAEADAKVRADADAAVAAKAAAAAAAAAERLRLEQEANSKAQAEAEARAKASANAEEAERARLESERLAAEQARIAEEQRKQQQQEKLRLEEERRKQEEAAAAAKTAAAAPQPAQPAPAGTSGDCSDTTALEPVALLGRLTDDQMGCLESHLQAAPKMTDKKKISLVQQANAWHKGDKGEWERLVKRHLEEIDQSDPDLCYRYAVHLSKSGVGRAQGVIRWSDVALENRSVWSGDTYTSRVNSLYKVRTAAAQALWQAAETDQASTPSDATRKKADDYRAMTKVYAREWYEYAKSAGKDTQTPLQVCIQAAGTAGYCEN